MGREDLWWNSSSSGSSISLAAVEEAVAIQRDLVATNRTGNMADLAASLHDVAGIHGPAGRRDDALAAANEAVALYEELASAYPKAFSDKLAGVRRLLTEL